MSRATPTRFARSYQTTQAAAPGLKSAFQIWN